MFRANYYYNTVLYGKHQASHYNTVLYGKHQASQTKCEHWGKGWRMRLEPPNPDEANHAFIKYSNLCSSFLFSSGILCFFTEILGSGEAHNSRAVQPCVSLAIDIQKYVAGSSFQRAGETWEEDARKYREHEHYSSRPACCTKVLFMWESSVCLFAFYPLYL